MSATMLHNNKGRYHERPETDLKRVLPEALALTDFLYLKRPLVSQGLLENEEPLIPESRLLS